MTNDITWELRKVTGAWQGGEVVDGRFEPLTGRGSLRGMRRQLKRRIEELTGERRPAIQVAP